MFANERHAILLYLPSVCAHTALAGAIRGSQHCGRDAPVSNLLSDGRRSFGLPRINGSTTGRRSPK